LTLGRGFDLLMDEGKCKPVLIASEGELVKLTNIIFLIIAKIEYRNQEAYLV
jgi:hypothetical protein